MHKVTIVTMLIKKESEQKRPRWQLRLCRISVASVFIGVSLLYCLSTLKISTSPTDFPVPLSCAPGSSHSDTNGSRQQLCHPKADIVFLKTHKTASSTFLNILFRFGEKLKLNFAFPVGQNDFSYPSYFQRSHVHGYHSGKCYNILCNHMRFNAPEVAKVVPRDAAYITILRDPAKLFESSFHYFGNIVPLTWMIPGDDKMAEFLRDPGLYYSTSGFNSFYLRNLLFFDLGHDNNLEPDDPRVDESIALLDERFRLVMLTEHFEESLVLLKDTLCWEMDDLLFFKLNSRKETTVSEMTLELRARALQWNAIDWRLYQYYNRTFWRKVEAYGKERMAKDVAELRKRNTEMMEICIEGGRSVAAESIRDDAMQPWQPFGEKSIVGYNLNKNVNKSYEALCRKMLTPEIQYLTELGVNLWLNKLLGKVRKVINW